MLIFCFDSLNTQSIHDNTKHKFMTFKYQPLVDHNDGSNTSSRKQCLLKKTKSTRLRAHKLFHRGCHSFVESINDAALFNCKDNDVTNPLLMDFFYSHVPITRSTTKKGSIYTTSQAPLYAHSSLSRRAIHVPRTPHLDDDGEGKDFSLPSMELPPPIPTGAAFPHPTTIARLPHVCISVSYKVALRPGRGSGRLHTMKTILKPPSNVHILLETTSLMDDIKAAAVQSLSATKNTAELSVERSEASAASLKPVKAAAKRPPSIITFTATRKVARGHRRIRFHPLVEVMEIPSHMHYTKQTRHAMWTPIAASRRNERRNRIEFLSENGGKDWRECTEEEDFILWPRSGIYLHPETYRRVYKKALEKKRTAEAEERKKRSRRRFGIQPPPFQDYPGHARTANKIKTLV